MTPAGRAGAFLAQVSSSTIMVCGDHNTVFFVALRGQKEVAVAVLQLPFFVPLRGLSWTKRSCRCRSAVAVLRAPSRPFVDKKKLPLPFCSCCSSCPLAALRGQKEVAVAVLQLPFSAPLRGPSWTKRSCRCRSAVAVLRVPSWPFVDNKKLPLPFCSCCSSCPFAALRGQKEVAVAVLQLPFSAPLRGPSWTTRSCRCRSAVAVLRAPSWPFVALRGQQEVAVAVLQLPFFVPLRDPSWTKRSCRCRSAVAVLRAPSRPFVDKKKLQLPFCSCCSSWPFVALRGPSWTTRSCSCRPAVAVLRAPSRPFVDKKKLQLPFSAPLRGSKRCSPRPSADRPQLSTQTGYALVAT